MSRWCNVIQTPNSPTPQENHCSAQLFSSEKRDNLDKYKKFINDLSVRIEGVWPPADYIPHDEDLLRHTLGFSPRAKLEKNSTRIRIKFLKETDSRYNLIRTRRLNLTRNQLLQPLQKENCSSQIKERSSNSQKTKNYRFNKAFRSKK